MLLPSDFLGQQVGLKGPAGIDSLSKHSLVCCIYFSVAGAIGAGLLNDQLIKESTYGYRQQMRYDDRDKGEE